MAVQDVLALARLGSSQGAEEFPELGVCVTETSQRRLLGWGVGGTWEARCQPWSFSEVQNWEQTASLLPASVSPWVR